MCCVVCYLKGLCCLSCVLVTVERVLGVCVSVSREVLSGAVVVVGVEGVVCVVLCAPRRVCVAWLV